MSPTEDSSGRLELECSELADRVRCGAEVARFALAAGLERQEAWKLGLCAMELAANAVRQGGGGGSLSVTVRQDGCGERWVEVVCDDRGPGLDAPVAAQGSPSLGTPLVAEHGPGIGLGAVKRLGDAMSVEARPGGGTRVTVKKRAPG